ncbi:GNAT family N-acetyltransferase [Streptomyces sp. A3M-1-3]|uniref:GNAT family N-acetyltransferase n=1 Tax=Streptomyces sp. A3M-1-3 TaxID=2962044 RepID=UPI0020B860B2|nr:N-acetyltransferase [Streptomyces sp. A3M-1-3]MCP3821012.1 GNAT family N-acetyltransferase [Streptomyces sp. A3M-1-3]
MEHVIRAVRAEEWPRVRELRIAALEDPAAPVAFLETREQAVARPDSFWQKRTAGASHGRDSRQFVAEGPDGTWDGSVVVLVEEAGTRGFFGEEIPVAQAHLVGVFVRPEQRGSGLTHALFDAAVHWAWSLEEPRMARVRLYVHERNERAQGFYRKFGFVRTGESVPVSGDPAALELELALARP